MLGGSDRLAVSMSFTAHGNVGMRIFPHFTFVNFGKAAGGERIRFGLGNLAIKIL
jgi:hypothetical protein